MKIVKYDRARGTTTTSSGSSGGGGGSSTTIEGGSTSLNRMIWGKQDTGGDIDGHLVCNGDITIKAITPPNYDDDDDEDGEDEEYDTGGGNLNVELNTTTKDLEVSNNAYIKNHLYINYNNSHSHSTNKKCVGELFNSVENNIASNLNEINSLKTRVSNNETAIESLDVNQQLADQSIKNNADEIEKLKKRATATEGAIENYMPIGSIIMFSGTMDEIPENWAICNGENGTPNLIDKFIKASNVAGETGGNNSIKLTNTDIPRINVKFNSDNFNEYKNLNQEAYSYLSKKIPAIDKIQEEYYDSGGSSNALMYTGNKKGDNGLVGVDTKQLFQDSANFLYAGNEEEYQTSVDIEPSYYSLIYIMKIA